MASAGPKGHRTAPTGIPSARHSGSPPRFPPPCSQDSAADNQRSFLYPLTDSLVTAFGNHRSSGVPGGSRTQNGRVAHAQSFDADWIYDSLTTRTTVNT
jgi:hypothetical protein